MFSSIGNRKLCNKLSERQLRHYRYIIKVVDSGLTTNEVVIVKISTMPCTVQPIWLHRSSETIRLVNTLYHVSLGKCGILMQARSPQTQSGPTRYGRISVERKT